MHARFAGSVASAMSSFTVYSVLSARSSLRATVVSARSAASSADPLLISSPGTPPGPGVVARDTSVDGEPCARLILNSLAVLSFVMRQYVRIQTLVVGWTHQEWSGSYLKTSSTVRMTSESSRSTRSVSSAQRWKTPWVPVVPIPSTMSAVIRNGTHSGMGSSFPW